MKHSLSQAFEIAHRGHEKLVRAISEGKYTVERLGKGYYRFTKEDKTVYETRVFIFPNDRSEYRVSCTCPFSQEGKENPYCKHGVEVKALTDWETDGPAARALFAEVLRERREREAENAHYDRLEKEWREREAYNRLCATAAKNYPLTDSERQFFIYEMLS